MQMREKRKNMKAQNKSIELTITEDDTELVVDKVKYWVEEELYVAEYQREEIMEVKEVPERLHLIVTHQRSIAQQALIHEEKETI